MVLPFLRDYKSIHPLWYIENGIYHILCGKMAWKRVKNISCMYWNYFYYFIDYQFVKKHMYIRKHKGRRGWKGLVPDQKPSIHVKKTFRFMCSALSRATLVVPRCGMYHRNQPLIFYVAPNALDYFESLKMMYIYFSVLRWIRKGMEILWWQ